MSPVESAILVKVKKLLNLAANQAATPEEAANAAARAQELLFKYNLELTDLELVPDGTSSAGPAIEHESLQLNTNKGRAGFQVNWHRTLVFGLARLNFCKAVYTRGTSHMSLVGEKHNVDAVRYFYLYVSTEIRRLAAAAVKVECTAVSGGERGQWVRDYSMGAVDTVLRRLREQRKADEARVQGTSQALVLVKREALVEQRFKSIFPKLSSGGRHAGTGNYGAYQAGQRDGGHISLNRPVGGGNARRSLS